MTEPKTESRPRVAAPFGWRTVTPLVMGSALNPVNSSVIATALVPIAAALHVPVGRTSILVSSLYLACAIAQPTAGKLAEEFGPRRVFLAGIVLVLLGGLVGGLGNNLAVLVVARVLIGVGTSCGYPSAMVIIRRRSHQAGAERATGQRAREPGDRRLGHRGDRAADRRPPGRRPGWRSAFLRGGGSRERGGAGREIGEGKPDDGRIGLFGGVAALLVFLSAAGRGAGVAFWRMGGVRGGGGSGRRPFIDWGLAVQGRLPGGPALGLRLGVESGLGTAMDGGGGVPRAGRRACRWAPRLRVDPVSRRNLVRGPLIACAFFSLLASAATLFITVHSPVIALVGVMVLFGVVVGTTVGGQPDRVVPPVTAGKPRDRLGPLADLRLHRVDRLGHDHQHRLPRSVSDAGLHDMALILVGVAAVVLLMTLLDRQLPRRSKA